MTDTAIDDGKKLGRPKGPGRPTAYVMGETRIIRNYLTALDQQIAPLHEDESTPQLLQRFAEIEFALPKARGLEKLELTQEQITLRQVLREREGTDVKEMERLFVKVAAAYAQRKKISRAAWLIVGVPADVLDRAGIYAP